MESFSRFFWNRTAPTIESAKTYHDVRWHYGSPVARVVFLEFPSKLVSEAVLQGPSKDRALRIVFTRASVVPVIPAGFKIHCPAQPQDCLEVALLGAFPDEGFDGAKICSSNTVQIRVFT